MKDNKAYSNQINMLILSLLENVDMYGYEMIKTLDEKSEHVFLLKEGTLYPVLHRLENEGCLKSYMDKSDQGRKRKYYQITKKGRRKLLEEKKEWQKIQTAVFNVVGGANAFA